MTQKIHVNYNDRISHIVDKLSTIKQGVEIARYDKLDSTVSRIENIEQIFQDSSANLDQQLNGLRDNLNKMDKHFAEQRMSYDQSFEKCSIQTSALDAKFDNAIKTQIIARKDGSNKIIKNFEDKNSSLHYDLSKESQTRVNQIEQLHQCLEGDLPKLNDSIKLEADERQEYDNTAMKSITDELIRINETLSQEKKNREESSTSIFEMLKDIIGKVQSEISQEKKTREDAEEYLLALLEDACNKLHTASTF